MSIVTSPSPRVVRSFARVLPPVKETRVAPRPQAEFAAGLEPVNILKPDGDDLIASRLPTIEGSGLTVAEFFRVNGAANQAKAIYATDMPEATPGEIHAVGQRAAMDALRQVLKDRPVALEPKAVEDAEPGKTDRWISVEMVPLTPNLVRVDAAAKPASRPVKTPVRKLAATDRPKPYTALDAAWWAANSPTSQVGYFVEGRIDPSDTYANTIAADEYRELVTAACFGEPLDLSDDDNGQFGYVREGGAE